MDNNERIRIGDIVNHPRQIYREFFFHIFNHSIQDTGLHPDDMEALISLTSFKAQDATMTFLENEDEFLNSIIREHDEQERQAEIRKAEEKTS